MCIRHFDTTIKRHDVCFSPNETKQIMALGGNTLTGQLPDAWSKMKKLRVSPLTDRMTADA